MQKSKTYKLAAGILAVITAVTPVASYAAEIPILELESPAQASEEKFLFLALKNRGGSVVLNKNEDNQETVKLDYHDVKIDGTGKKEPRLFIDVYDKDGVLLSSNEADKNNNIYMYTSAENDIVTIDVISDPGYEILRFDKEGEVLDFTSPKQTFSYTTLMEEDAKFNITFRKEEDLTVAPDKEEKPEETPETKPEEDLTVAPDAGKETDTDSDLTVAPDGEEAEDKSDTDSDLTVAPEEKPEEDTADDLIIGAEVNTDETENTEESEENSDDLIIGSDNDESDEETEETTDKDTEDTTESDIDEATDDDLIIADDTEETADDETEIDEAEEEDSEDKETLEETDAPEEHFLENSDKLYTLDATQFETARLVILADDPTEIIDREHIIANYNNIYLMQYGSVEQSMNAYLYYAEFADSVEPDATVEMAGEETEANPETAEIAEEAEEATETSSEPETETTPEESPEETPETTEKEDSVQPEGTAPVETTEIEVTSEVNPLAILAETDDTVPTFGNKVIALIDTGASAHQNVIDRVSMIDDDAEGTNTHGDDMIEAIVAQNPDAKILSIRALDNKGQGTISAIVAGMEYAMEQNVDIINLSLYAKTSLMNRVLETEVQKAVDMGIEVVGAAGNSGANVIDFIPGNIDAAWILGAADETGARLETSNYGKTVDYNVVAKSTSEAAATFSGYLSKHGKENVKPDNELIFDTNYVPGEEDDLDGTEHRIYLSISENIEIKVDKHHAKPGEKVRFKVIGKNGLTVPYGLNGVEQEEQLDHRDMIINVANASDKEGPILPGGTIIGYDVDEEDEEYYWFYMPGYDALIYAYETVDYPEEPKTEMVEYVYEPDIFDETEDDDTPKEPIYSDGPSKNVERVTLEAIVDEEKEEGVPVLTFDDTFVAAVESIPTSAIDDVKVTAYSHKSHVPPSMGAKGINSSRTYAATMDKEISYSINLDGEKTYYTLPAYCLQPDKKDPNAGNKKPEQFEEITGSETAGNVIMTRILYYGWKGPGWGKNTTKKVNGKEEQHNLKTFMEGKKGLSTSSSYGNEIYATIHYMLAYEYFGNAIFDSSGKATGNERDKRWGIGRDANGNHVYAFNKLQPMIDCLEEAWAHPIPKTRMEPEDEDLKMDKMDELGKRWRSRTYSFKSNLDDKAYIKELRKGVTLYNETLGTTIKGPKTRADNVHVNAGHSWHVEVDYDTYFAEYHTKYLNLEWETRFPNVFSTYKLKKDGDVQDLGFLFTSKSEPILHKGTMKRLSETVTPPPPSVSITPPTGGGGLYVKKTSTVDPEILALHSYSLAGAEFEVTPSRTDGGSGILTTGEDGISNSLELPDNHQEEEIKPTYDKDGNMISPGYTKIIDVTTTYTVKEIKAPKGHKMNNSTPSFSVTMPGDIGRTIEVPFEDEPYFCKNKLDIEKLDSKGNPIEGVVYKVEFFDATSPDEGDAIRTWYLETDKNGRLTLDDAHISRRFDEFESDPFFLHKGQIVIPIDCYMQFTEVKAPAEYVVDEKPFGFITGEEDSLSRTIKTGNPVYNDPELCEIRIKKLKEDEETPIAGVEFELTFLEESKELTANKNQYFQRLLKVGESIIFSTDANGEVVFPNLDQGKYRITEVKTHPGYELLKEPIYVTLPMTMTETEAYAYGNVDFESAKNDENYTNKWFFYDCMYKITNHAHLDMPMTGGLGTWKYGFIGMGIIAMISTGLVVQNTRKKRKKQKKHKSFKI